MGGAKSLTDWALELKMDVVGTSPTVQGLRLYTSSAEGTGIGSHLQPKLIN